VRACVILERSPPIHDHDAQDDYSDFSIRQSISAFDGVPRLGRNASSIVRRCDHGCDICDQQAESTCTPFGVRHVYRRQEGASHVSKIDFREGPLAGIRVIDLTSVIMGPFATHVMADMGADVIKVESPEGDSFRTYRPNRSEGMSGGFVHLNRNKRGIVLDLKSEQDQRVLATLIKTADVLVHSLRPKAAQKLKLGYSDVSAINPNIIYCGAYGFGEEGPYRDKAAYDDIIQAGSGLAALHMDARGEPAYMPTVLCDKLSGQAMAYSVLAALLQRERGGGGQAIEVPMFETTAEFAFIEHLVGFAFEPPLGPPEYKRVVSAMRKPFRTKDGYMCLLPYSDRNWSDFFEFVGRQDLAQDPRYAKLVERVGHIEYLYGVIEQEAPDRTNQEWTAFCDRVSIPCMPVLALADLPLDKHMISVGMFEVAEHPTEGAYKAIRRPVNFSGSSFQIRHHAPRLGQHNGEILSELGLTSSSIPHESD
jgi:crotonobetainyl-CoA:carnitine CoA-transferase CaiB-like acyl-CoA transferase